METISSAFRDDAARSIESEELDAFGHREYATALVNAVRAVPSPFTLGLFGAWGTGKSTVLTEVGRRVSEELDGLVAYASFDAWRYEGDSLRREFIREVATDLDSAKQLSSGFDVEEHLKPFHADLGKTQVAKIQFSCDAVLPAVVAAAGVFSLLVLAAFLVPLAGFSHTTALNVILALLGPTLAFVLLTLNRVIVPPPIQETLRRYEAPEQFAKNFAELLEHVTAPGLVVGIDNLDRCSPDRVAEVLATIKTFLEPAIGGPGAAPVERLCFIVAADDEALRRHLITQEMARSPLSVGDLEDAKEARDEAKVAVDEYLRKFFNGYVRLNDVLDEDIRTFTAEELEPFRKAHPEIAGETVEDLIEITAHGLQRNPRRIKQFVNNLELRTQLLNERRAAGGIQITPDILVIAKLAVIEEEFAPEYRELADDPALLDRWHRQAASDDTDGSGNRRLEGFLRFTDHITTQHLRAYLTLKQTEDERSLPRYVEFTGLLDDGDVTAATEFLQDDEAAPAYVAAVRRYFEQQLVSRAWSTAHNVLRCIIGVDGLRASSGVVAFAVDEALSHPPLRSRLPQLDQEDLVRSAKDRLAPARFEDLLLELARTIPERGEGAPRAALFEALANASESLSGKVLDAIGNQIDQDGVREDFASYQPLAEVRPSAVGVGPAESALSSLEQDDSAHLVTDPRFRIAQAVARTESSDALVARFFALLDAWLAEFREEEGGAKLNELVRLISESIEAWPENEGLEVIAVNLHDGWEQTPVDVRAQAIGLGLRLCELSEKADAATGKDTGQRALESYGVGQMAQWVGDGSRRLPSALTEGVVTGARSVLTSQSEDERRGAVDLLKALVPASDLDDYIAQAAKASLDDGPTGAAGHLLSFLPRARAAEMFGEVLAELESSPPNASRASLIADFQDRLDESQRLRAVSRLVDAVTGDREQIDALAPVISRFRLSDAGNRLDAVERLVAFERDVVTGAERGEALLRAAYALAGPSRARSVVDERLELIRDSDQKPNLRELAKGLLEGRRDVR
jgi:KAP family P-loop domain